MTLIAAALIGWVAAIGAILALLKGATAKDEEYPKPVPGGISL